MSAAGARIRLAVDAANVLRDRRGMGRIARAVLAAASAAPDFEVTLLADRRDDVAALRHEVWVHAVRPAATARRRGEYDVVWFPFNGMRFAAAAPSLVTMHDAFAFTEPHVERIARFREQRPIRRAARDATRILTDSAWSRAEIVRELGVAPERIAVVHPSPDRFWFPAHDERLPKPLTGQRYALVVGVREARKNARLALEACVAALQGPGESLVIVGELQPATRQYARTLGLRAGEIAAGDDALRALYRNARVVLVPSFAEGFGLVAIEAMACGAAVIASNASALPEATDGAALLLDPRDTAGWAHAIRRLFDDDAALAALRARGATRFAAADRDASQRRVLALLRELARSAA